MTVVLLGLITSLGFAQVAPMVPDHVVISEVYITGTSDWIGLYNPTNEDIDLADGYRIERATSSGGDPDVLLIYGTASYNATHPGGTVIPAHGFYLHVRNSASQDLKDEADALSDFALTEDNVIYLATDTVSAPSNSHNSDPDIVDYVGYGSAHQYEGSTQAPAILSGKSIQRKPLSEGYASAQDTDDNFADFEIKAIPTPMNSGDTLVDPAPVVVVDGVGDFKGGFGAIQAAVDAAGSGDIINVAAGTYVEDVTIDRDVTLNGTGNPTATSFTLTNGAVVSGSSGITAPTVNVNQLGAVGAKIQDAILLVASGGTVNVTTGTYAENITINKALRLKAASNPVIEPETGTAVTIAANDVTITGFIIQNAVIGVCVNRGSSGIELHFNDIIGDTTQGLENNSVTEVIAPNNWWGTNAPTQGTEFSANVDADPWIQFVLKTDQNRVVVGGDSTLTAKLQNSDDEVPTGIDQLPLYQGAKKAGFETDLGTVGSSAITKDLVNGEATATLTSTDSGTATVTVQAKDAGDNPINGAQDTTTVEFLAGASASIGLTANPLNILADGSSASTITATVRDGYGNLVEDGTNVTFTTDRGTMASTHPTTNGVAQATLTAGTETGVATINVQVNGASADIAVFLKEPGGANVCSAKTEKTEPGDDTVDAKDETGCEIDKSGDGTPVITAARYEENPGGTPIFSPFEGSYFDVHLDDSTDVDEVMIRYYYPKDVDESSLVMYWWDGSYWEICSNFWVNTTDTNGYGGYMAARITATSTPNLDDLSGQVFAAGVAAGSMFKHRYYEKSGYWMISLPFTPDPTDPVQLKDDLQGAEIYTYDPAVGDYVIPTELRMGQAYWAWFNGTTDIDATGHKFSGSPQRINCAIAGWHMIGPAYLRHSSETTCWGEVWVEHDGETVSSVHAAAERGWLKPFVIRYDPDISPDYCYWCGYEEAILVPWKGYWVMTLLPNVTLQFHFIPAPPLSALALDDPQAMGFQPAEADTPLPPAPPTWTSEAGGQWRLDVAIGADAAQFQVVGPLASHVDALRLEVFDLSGTRIYEEEVSGRELTWPYTTSSGERLSNGIVLMHLSGRIDGVWEAGELMKILILR